jgi:hypothetical protein
MRWFHPVWALCLLLGLPGCTFDASGLGADMASNKLDVNVDATLDQRVESGLGDLKRADRGPDIYDPTDLAITPPDTSADAGGLLFVPSNLSGSYWALGQTDLVISGKVVVDTTTGKLTSGSLPAGVGLYCTQEYCVLTVKKLALNKGSELRVEGKRPLIIVATDDITVAGSIIAAAAGLNAGPGGYMGGTSSSDGQGCGGGYKTESKRKGGAGGSFGGYGGKGGEGPAGKTPCVEPCTMGHCPTITCLTPLQGGSGGACGGEGDGLFGLFAGDGGRGGAGGGAVQLSSLKSITVKKSGLINVGGGGAQGGGSSLAGGGGGGSGGGILLEAGNIIIDGTIAANGGGGGGGAIIVKGGSPGSSGAASATAVAGGGGGAAWPDKGGSGGSGSSKADPNGGDGNKGSGVTYAHGGGGGSSGRICIRTATGKMTLGKDATISPFPAAYNLLTLP